MDTRETALLLFVEMEKTKNFGSSLIRDTLNKYDYEDPREKAFLKRLTEGTLESLLTLDYVINAYSKTPTNKMKPLIRSLLEMSVYQLKYMDNVPVSAVCNEAVKLAGKRHFVNLKGFVNGVLRNIARNDCACEYPDQKKEPVKYLSVRYSMPEELVAFFKKQADDTTVESILAGFYKEKTTYIRCNTKKLTVEELKAHLLSENIQAEAVEGLPYALKITGYDYLLACESFQRGEFFVQDISSMLAGELASPAPHDRIIDVCAAPGGKSMNVALKLTDGSVEARDLTPLKTQLIRENIARLGLDNISVKEWDARVSDTASKESADIVLADLPCSGLGIIGRKPDIKYHTDIEKIEQLASLQREILTVVQEYVKPGGTLVYSTCTISRPENEENAAWFEKNFPFVREGSAKQLLPGIDGTDGFFMVKFRKKL